MDNIADAATFPSAGGGELAPPPSAPALLTLPSHAELPNASIRLRDVIHPAFPPPSASPAALESFLLSHADESLLTYGVCEVPFLSPFGAALLGARSRELLKPLGGERGNAVGSLHAYRADLLGVFASLDVEIGAALEPLFQLLFGPAAAAPAATLAVELPPHPSGVPRPREIALHTSHLIAYGTDGSRNRALQLHTDDSLYTATVCVIASPALRGTDLVFHGMQRLSCPALASHQARYAALKKAHGVDVGNPEHHANQLHRVPREGFALLHRGKHLHRTLPVQDGERFSWVMWWHPTSDWGGGQAANAGGGV